MDKTKPSEAMVPIDIAREVIRVGRLSAYAQLCELCPSSSANYQTLMRREESQDGKWTPTSRCCSSTSCTSRP